MYVTADYKYLVQRLPGCRTANTICVTYDLCHVRDPELVKFVCNYSRQVEYKYKNYWTSSDATHALR